MAFLTLKLSRKYGTSLKMQLFNKIFTMNLYKDLESENTCGVQNKCQNGMHVVFLDYDSTMLNEQLIPEIKGLIHKWRLSDFYLFKSSQKPYGYHAVCLDKLTAREWVTLLEETSVDKNYKLAPINLHTYNWVLRFLPKGSSQAPEYIRRLISPFNDRIKSRPHALFLKYQYGIDINGIKKLDKETRISLVRYETLNYLKKPLKEGLK
jgi:hypothetical protein